MNTSIQSLNKTRRGCLRRLSVTPPRKSTSSDQEDAFESDSEDDSDDELSDFSDEEVLVNTETNRMRACDSSKATVGPTVSPMSTIRKDRVIKKEDGLPKFILALSDAVQLYSSRMRNPVHSSPIVKWTPSSKSPPKSLYEILSDSDDNTKQGKDESDSNDNTKKRASGADESGPPERPSDSPPNNTEALMQLLYHPSEPWAALSHSPIENPVVVAKLNAGAMHDTYIKQGVLDGRTVTYISKVWLLSQKWEGFFSELALFSDPDYLRPLQGSVIPRIIGYYSVEGGVSVAMELPSSEFWIEASDDMSVHLKQKCISAFDAIHERGVLHDCVELRHMLISSRGDVTITNFENSRALKPVEKVGMKAATVADISLEKRKVRFKLNYEDSRAKETGKVRRASDLEARIRLRSVKDEGSPSSTRVGLSIPDEENGPEHPRGELSPAVDSKTFMEHWVGSPSAPVGYIVPGQNPVQLSSRFQEFLMMELDRLDKDDASGRVVPTKTSRSPVASPTPSPILPTRIKLKRERDDDDAVPFDTPLSKKRFIESPDVKVEDSTTKRLLTAELSPVIASPSDHSRACSGPKVSNFADLVPEIHVPYEGYAGSDGYVIPNTFSPNGLATMRQVWIQHYTMKCCREEKLPYPIAEVRGLVPTTLPKFVPYDENGNKNRKRKPIRNMGALRRMRMSKEELERKWREAIARREEYFRNRHEPGTGLSDSEASDEDDTHPCIEDDGVAEGPKIMTWHELGRLSPRDETYCPSSFPPPESPQHRPVNPKQAKPLKSSLCRQLTETHKARNVALLEDYKRRNDSGSDEDEMSTGFWRPLKRVRIDLESFPKSTSPSEHDKSSQNQQDVSSLSEAGPSNNRAVSSCSVVIPHVSRLSGALASPSPPRGSSPSNSTVPDSRNDASPDATSYTTFALSDGHLIPKDGDQDPTSSALPQTQGNRYWYLQEDSDSDSDSAVTPCSSRPVTTTDEKEKHIWGIPLSLPWRWPMLKK